MFLKQFRAMQVRVADPLRPGKRTFEERLVASGASGVSHGGKNYAADEDGWIDLPDEVGETVLRVRFPKGERFFTPHEVNEEVMAGRISDGDATPQRRGPGRPRRDSTT